MSDVPSLAGALAQGARLALEFNPVAAALSAALAAFVAGSQRAGRRGGIVAGAVLIAGWLLGDGAAFAAAVADAAQPSGGVGIAAALAAWACGSLALGYALPAVIGIAVGRRVFFGTGRLAAAMVAFGSSLALVALAGAAHIF